MKIDTQFDEKLNFGHVVKNIRKLSKIHLKLLSNGMKRDIP